MAVSEASNATFALDINRPDLTVGVVGSGTMGRGIAQVLAHCGVRTLVYDAKAGAAQTAKASIGDALAKLAEKGRITPQQSASTLQRLEVVAGLADLAPCHIVVEAIIEDLEAKRALWRELGAIVSDRCILASNTSSLSVSAMASCPQPERLAGYHFFNPVPVLKVVEVVAGELTAAWVTDALTALAKRFGHTPVRCKDTPGFIVNHAGRGYVPESLRVLAEGVADFATIDRVLVEAAGFRMGPFSLMDLVGLDVSHGVMKSMYAQYFGEPKYQPWYALDARVAAGLLGRKSGRGWYRYEGGAVQTVQEALVPIVADPPSVWVPAAEGELRELLLKLGAQLESGAAPSAAALCVIAPLGEDATGYALRLGLDARRTVAVDALFGFNKRRTLMLTSLTQPDMRDAAHALLARDGVPVSLMRDSAGFIAQRVVAHIVNIGCDIVQQRIARPHDLDRAVVLGLNYPNGPLAMGDALGAGKILAVLEAMHAFYQEPRYRPSPWLRRRAALGVSLLTPEPEI